MMRHRRTIRPPARSPGLRVEKLESRELLSLIPLNDLGLGTYQGYVGGLYANGADNRPAAIETYADNLAKQIVPLNASGNPDPTNGKIVFAGVGTTTVRQAFGGIYPNFTTNLAFAPQAAADPTVNPHLTVVTVAPPSTPAGGYALLGLTQNPPLNPYPIMNQDLANAGVTPAQVQAIWYQDVDPNPQNNSGPFPADPQTLKGYDEATARIMLSNYPNLKIMYFSSMMHVFSTNLSNNSLPEPWDYEGAFAIQWMVQDQENGVNNLNYDSTKGPVVAPLLLEGPYLWATDTPRSDGFTWLTTDLMGSDGPYPSVQGDQKVANQLLAFYKTDPTGTPWFLNPATAGQAQGPVVTASSTTLSSSNGLTIQFNASATDPNPSATITQYAWTYDDGDFSLAQNPVKSFLDPGTYNVHLTVSDSLGYTTTKVIPINVPYPTTVTLSAPTVSYNNNGTVSVTVSAPTGAPTPTGSVSLTVDGGTPVSQSLSQGSSTFTIASPALGSHTLSVSYAAQGNFAASSATGTLTVNPAATTIALTTPDVTYNNNGTVTVTVSPPSGVPTPTGTVSLTVDGGTPVSQTLSQGSSTFTITSPSVGGHSLSTSYTAQGNYASSTATATLNVNAAPTTMAVAAPDVSYNANGTVTVTVSAAAGVPTPTGAVTLTVDGVSAGSQTLSAQGTATFTLTSPSVGTHTLATTYATQGNYIGTSLSGTLLVSAAPVTITMDTSSVILPANGTVVVTVSSGVGPPTGSVSLSLDGGTATSQTLSAQGTASFTISSPNAGTHTLLATYAGQGNFASASASITLFVNQWTTSVAVLAPSVASGSNAVVTVTVSSPTATTAPSGTATLAVDGGTPLSATLSAQGTASFTVTSPSVGTHTLVASYAAQGNFAGSSEGGTLAVAPLATGLTLSAPSVTYNANGIVTVTLSARQSATTATTSNSNVTLSVDGGTATSTPLTDQGIASFTLVSPSAGDHSLFINYGPLGALSGTLHVNAAPTMLSLSAPDVAPGADGLITVTVSPPTGVPIPTGTVSLSVDGGTALTASLSAQGTATFDLPSMNAGTHTLAATYAAQGNYGGSSASGSIYVNAIPTTLTIANPDITYGVAANVTVTVASGFATPAGNVVLTVDGTTALTQALVSGATTFSLANLDAGNHTLSASFAAQTRFAASSNSGSQTVYKANPTITWSNPADIVYGTALSNTQLNATISVVGPAAAGALTYTPAAGTVLNAGSGQILSVTAAGTLDYNPATVTVAINVTLAPLTVTANNQTKGYGAALPALTGTLTGVVNGDNITASYSTTATSSSPVGSYSITATLNDPNGRLSNYTVTNTSGTLTITKALSSTTASASSNSAYFGLSLTLTATVSSQTSGLGTPTGSVDFYDTTTATDLGSVNLSGGTATLSTTALPLGAQTITLSYGGDSTFLTSSGSVTVTVVSSAFELNTAAGTALALSGSSSIVVSGLVQVNSGLAMRNTSKIVAGSVRVVGRWGTMDSSTISPTPVAGPALSDPLAGLPVPTVSNLQNRVNLSSGSLTINPGVYTGINVTGGSLTMNPGIYVMAGAGFAITGSGSVSGSGVLIYNAGTNYNGSGNTFGGLTLNSTGTINLTPATTGPYADVLVFQSRDNTRAMSIGSSVVAAMQNTIIYAPMSVLSVSNSAQLPGAVVVAGLQMLGSASLTQTTSGSDAASDIMDIPGQLLQGNLAVYINDPTGYFTADELARIQDTINSLNALLTPYSVAVTEVSDPSQATIVIDAGLTSASGSAADGVLGCYNGPNNEITMLEGWDWYSGADPTQIGAGQYDFQTVITHELGHALGLGGSTVATSPMNEVLAAGMTRRTLAVADLNIPNVDEVVDPERAAPIARSSLAGLVEQAPGTGMASVPASLGTEQPARVPSEFTSDRGKSQVLFGMDLSPRMIVLSPAYRAGGGMTIHITFPSQDQTAAESTRWIGSWGWANGPSLESMARKRYDGSASPSLAAGLSAVMRDWGGSRAVSHSTWNAERWLEPERASGALPDSASLPGSESAGMLTQEAITDWLFAAVGIAATVAVPPALLSERRRQEQPRIRSQNQSV